MWSAWRALKDHAKARHISFRLSLGHFRKFALATDYLNRTGSNGHCLTVDRINNRFGYYPKNIQPLTRSENAIKRARRDAIRMESDSVRLQCKNGDSPVMIDEEGKFVAVINRMLEVNAHEPE